jgi:hypothetical protein
MRKDKVTESYVRRVLRGAVYPISGKDLAAYVHKAEPNAGLTELIRKLPEKEYKNEGEAFAELKDHITHNEK